MRMQPIPFLALAQNFQSVVNGLAQSEPGLLQRDVVITGASVPLVMEGLHSFSPTPKGYVRGSILGKFVQHPGVKLHLSPRLDWDIDFFHNFPDYIECHVRRKGKVPRIYKDQLIFAMRFGIYHGGSDLYESYLMPTVNLIWAREQVLNKVDSHGGGPGKPRPHRDYNIFRFNSAAYRWPTHCEPVWDDYTRLIDPPGFSDPSKQLKFTLDDSINVYERFPDTIACEHATSVKFELKSTLLIGIPSKFGQDDVYESRFFDQVHYVWRRIAKAGADNVIYKFLYLKTRQDFNCWPEWDAPRTDIN